jgi:hypothetical protein
MLPKVQPIEIRHTAIDAKKPMLKSLVDTKELVCGGLRRDTVVCLVESKVSYAEVG